MRESVLDLLLNLKEIVLKKNNNFNLQKQPSSRTSAFLPLPASSGAVAKQLQPQLQLQPGEANARVKQGPRPLPALRARQGSPSPSIEGPENTVSSAKQIYCESSSFYKPIIGYLKVKGPGVIRAKDLKLPSFIQCVDPEQYIATLAEDGFLSMKILIMEGKGYLIQKNNSFIDYNLVKKRSNFLNELSYQTLKSDTFFKKSQLPEENLISGAHDSFSKTLKKANFQENKPLNLDCIFNPVTKVSYIIEDFNNKVITDFHDNMTFINDISSLIESSHYLNKNFPYLTKEISLNKKSILDFLEIYTKSEIKEISNYLHPLKKPNSLHNIILEIWTNGSIHPREALYFGFQNLSTTFLNLQLLL
jgi:DNA-directed RNA polymerase alpha subunit